ncbi:hypothetical protein DPMN_145144 [Dreissena polymorpha]|uniref:Uncharacterized protein n=1 Tax=Dreissena polymorpha TaxID=45954 RepID=A0A9D4F826_DREPO|nr:hypothetical protein DPMN_145144 [Dreissena polymorpha]
MITEHLHKKTSTNKSKPEPRGNSTKTKRESKNRKENTSDEVKVTTRWNPSKSTPRKHGVQKHRPITNVIRNAVRG